VSIGGANGMWPATMGASDVATFEKWMADLGVDGLDIDLEYGSVAQSLKSLAPVIQKMTARGQTVAAAPLAATQYLNLYKSTMPLLSWV
jgi:chitinase